MALVFLDTYMPHHAPRWLSYGDGVQPAAFGVIVPATHLSSARLWLWTFLTDGMPRLLASVLAVNARAGHARRPTGPRATGRPGREGSSREGGTRQDSSGLVRRPQQRPRGRAIPKPTGVHW